MKISELPASTDALPDDMLEVSQTLSGSPESRRHTYAQMIRRLARLAGLGSAAFLDQGAMGGVFPEARNATGSISVDDRRKLLLATSGAPTLTLPPATDCEPGWTCFVKARGTTATVARAGADTINGGTSLAVADGETYRIVRSGDTAWETMR